MSGNLTTLLYNVTATAEPENNVTLADHKWFKILKYTLYSIIFLISFIGNSMVCFVVSRRMKVKTVTNYFIMNLAIADLLYTLCIPLDIFATEKKTDWPYGSFMCRVLWPAQTLTITVSGFTLTALSVTRYWAVVNALRRQLSVIHGFIVIMLLWFLATTTMIPYVIFLKYSQGTCDEDWPDYKQRQVYTASLFVIQYAMPLTIIATCYIRIGIELTRGQNTYNKMLAKARGKEARKVIKMLIIVTLTFAILTLPSSIMWMWNDFGKAEKTFTSFWDLMDVLNILDFLNSATNPIIYSFCNERFSREFRSQLGCLRPPQPSTDTDQSGRCTSLIPMVPASPTSNNNDKNECNGDCSTLL